MESEVENAEGGTAGYEKGNHEQRAAELPDTSENPSSSDHVPKKRKSALADLLGETFKTNIPLSATSTAEKEIRQYQEAPSLPLTDDPLIWWKTQAPCYPQLAKLAQRYLCVPGTSVSSERIFSTAGDIITTQRSMLTSEHADQLLFLNKNMHI